MQIYLHFTKRTRTVLLADTPSRRSNLHPFMNIHSSFADFFNLFEHSENCIVDFNLDCGRGLISINNQDARFDLTPAELGWRLGMTITMVVFQNTISINVDGSTTLRKLKSLIQNSQGIPADLQRLTYKGSFLADDKTLADYQVSDKATIWHVRGC